MHRDLAFHRSKLAAPIELQGRSHKKPAQNSPTSQGRWEDFIGNSRDGLRSPKAVQNRAIESANAHRTMRPELGTDEVYHRTRKINAKDTSAEPGNLMNLFKKSGTMDDVYGSRKKYFKEYEQSAEVLTPRVEKRYVKPHERKLDDYCSQIPTLPSPTYVEKYGDSSPQSGFGSPRSPTGKLKQEALKSSIGILSNGSDTKKNYVDVDEYRINQSMHSPKTVKHMASTYLDEPLHPTTYKKDPNRTNYSTYESGNRLNPWTKGKKVEYPQYTEKNATSAVPDNGGVYSPRSGGFEPLDLMHVGRRSIPAKQVMNNIVTPPAEKNVPRGQAVYSYRTYQSQIF